MRMIGVRFPILLKVFENDQCQNICSVMRMIGVRTFAVLLHVENMIDVRMLVLL